MEYVAIAATVIGGIQSIQMGKAQQDMYNAQAQQSLMQARSAALAQRADTLEYKRQGVAVMENLVRNMATVNARAAAGAIDPFSGSVSNLVTANLEKGVTDFYTSRENVELSAAQSKLIEASGGFQAAQYTAAGSFAKRQGYMNALASFGQAAYMGSEMGTFRSSPRTDGGAPIVEKSYG